MLTTLIKYAKAVFNYKVNIIKKNRKITEMNFKIVNKINISSIKCDNL